MGNLRTCGNCRYMKILKAVPFVNGFWVGEGRCRLFKKDKHAGYRAVGDSCGRFSRGKKNELFN